MNQEDINRNLNEVFGVETDRFQDLGGDLEKLELIGEWSKHSDLGRVREAITFDRHGSSYSLVKIKYQDSKVLSITKLKPNTEALAKSELEKWFRDYLLTIKKQPSDTAIPVYENKPKY